MSETRRRKGSGGRNLPGITATVGASGADPEASTFGRTLEAELMPRAKTHVLDEARRQKGSRGWWEAQRKIDKCHRASGV